MTNTKIDDVPERAALIGKIRDTKAPPPPTVASVRFIKWRNLRAYLRGERRSNTPNEHPSPPAPRIKYCKYFRTRHDTAQYYEEGEPIGMPTECETGVTRCALLHIGYIFRRGIRSDRRSTPYMWYYD